MHPIVADIGGTFLRCGVVEPTGIVAIEKLPIHNFLGGFGADAIWDFVVGSIAEYANRVSDIAGNDGPIVIAFPGPIDDSSVVRGAPTIAGESSQFPNLKVLVAERTRRQVYLLNDVSAAAWHISESIAEGRFMALTVSSGIGSKIFDKGTPTGVFDTLTYSGEIGHVKVDNSAMAPLCDCGKMGHLGAISSGRGIERFARRLAHEDCDGFATSMCSRVLGASPGSLTNEGHIIPAALSGDEWMICVIRMATEPLSQVLASIIVAAGLEKVVVIGGFAIQMGELYLELLRSAIAAKCDAGPLSPPIDQIVVLGSSGDRTCLLGAATFANRLNING